MGNLELWDQMVTLSINSVNSPWSDQIWIFFSNRFVWAPLYLAVAGLLVWRLGWKRGLVAILTLVLTILAVDQTCNFVKDLVARLRPCNDESVILQGLHMLEGPSEKYKYGFFSGHSANAFAFALGSILAFRKDSRLLSGSRASGKKMNPWMLGYTIGINVWAFLVAISRIFVGKHFFGDIFIGALVGLFIAWIIFLLSDYLYDLVAAKTAKN